MVWSAVFQHLFLLIFFSSLGRNKILQLPKNKKKMLLQAVIMDCQTVVQSLSIAVFSVGIW